MFDTSQLIGLNKKDAIQIINNNGFLHRITQEDKNSFMVTMDLRIDRVNLAIENNQVVAADIG